MHFRIMLAEADGRAGQAEEGLGVLMEALASVSQDTVCHYKAELYRRKGELLLQQTLRNGDARTVSTATPMVAGATWGGRDMRHPHKQRRKFAFAMHSLVPAAMRSNLSRPDSDRFRQLQLPTRNPGRQLSYPR
jgi:hypothetical protein